MIEIEMYQKNKIEKYFLKIFECLNFCFYKFVKRNIELTFSKMIFRFFEYFFDKIHFFLL